MFEKIHGGWAQVSGYKYHTVSSRQLTPNVSSTDIIFKYQGNDVAAFENYAVPVRNIHVSPNMIYVRGMNREVLLTNNTFTNLFGN